MWQNKNFPWTNILYFVKILIIRTYLIFNTIEIINLFLCFFLFQVQTSGLFELRLKYFKNDYGRDSEGHCCSGQSDAASGKCIGGCKTRFRVCLKHYQAKIDTTSQCTYGDVVTPILGENSVNLTDSASLQNKEFLNPIQFAFNFAWPVSVNFFDIFRLRSC